MVNSDIEIIEVGARDGLQNESTILSTALKLELIHRLVAAGARRIEVASFVNPKRVPQMADAEEVVAGLPPAAGLAPIVLVLNRRGFERALAARSTEISLVAVASDAFGLANQGADIEQSMQLCEELIPLARTAGVRATVTISVAFGCPYEGEIPAERVVQLARRLGDLAPYEIVLADTIGVAVPVQVARLLDAVRAVLPNQALRGHFHNTRNTALANIQAAYQAGVRRFDCSVGGIGGCPFAPKAGGNVATEDVVYMFERSGVTTHLELTKLIDTAQWLGPLLGHPLPSALARAGAFPTRRA